MTGWAGRGSRRGFGGERHLPGAIAPPFERSRLDWRGRSRSERHSLCRLPTADCRLPTADRRRLEVVRREILLPRAANGTDPVARDLLEGGSGRHAAVRVALLGVV